MKKINLIFLLLLTLGNAYSQSLGTTESITQRGITWTFDRAYQYGKFVSGDYWILDDGDGIEITAITTDISTIEFEGENYTVSGTSSTLNPRWGSHAYCSRSYGYDSESLFSASQSLYSGDVLVTVTALSETVESTDLYSAAILTAVDQVITSDKFRPPYCRPTRISNSAADPLIFSADDIAWDKLPALNLPNSGNNVPPVIETIHKINKPWIDHLGTSWMGVIHPLNHFPWYGRDVSQIVSEAACQAMLNHPQNLLDSLVVQLIQIGIDYYGIVLDNGEWHADGGHASGRKFPVLFAGIMLDNFYKDPESLTSER